MIVRSPPPPQHQPIEFAGFDLVRQIGTGGAGEVWSALKIGELYTRPLVIKVLRPEYWNNKEYRQMFIEEARTSMRLSSGKIVPVFDFGEHEGMLYLVMERVDGVNLREFQRRVLSFQDGLHVPIAAYILSQILAALYSAHELTEDELPAGVIHRDVKPENVLVSSDGEIRLTDFGIAARTNDRSLGVIAGSPGYMAPEHARGHAVVGSDLFAAGAIFHELVSGQRFRNPRGDRDARWQEAQSYSRIPPLPVALPAALENVRQRLLHPNVAERFGSAKEALVAIKGSVHLEQTAIADIYKAVVGGRSSGYTDSRRAAQVSFVQKWHSQITERRTRESVRLVEVGEDEETVVRPGCSSHATVEQAARALLDSGSVRNRHPPAIRRPPGRSLRVLPATNKVVFDDHGGDGVSLSRLPPSMGEGVSIGAESETLRLRAVGVAADHLAHPSKLHDRGPLASSASAAEGSGRVTTVADRHGSAEVTERAPVESQPAAADSGGDDPVGSEPSPSPEKQQRPPVAAVNPPPVDLHAGPRPAEGRASTSAAEGPAAAREREAQVPRGYRGVDDWTEKKPVVGGEIRCSPPELARDDSQHRSPETVRPMDSQRAGDSARNLWVGRRPRRDEGSRRHLKPATLRGIKIAWAITVVLLGALLGWGLVLLNARQ